MNGFKSDITIGKLQFKGICKGVLFKYKNKRGRYIMTETLIVALISLFGTLTGTFGGIVVSSKLTNYRIEQLEKKVEKHNGVIDRTYKLEEKEAVVTEQIRVINHRIADLEGAK